MIVKRRWAARRLAEVGDGRSVEMVGGMEFWLLRERKGDCSHFMSVSIRNECC